MSEATTQQPDALRLAELLDPDNQHDHGFCMASIKADGAATIRRQHAEIARLTAENEALRACCKPLTDQQIESLKFAVQSLRSSAQLNAVWQDFVSAEKMCDAANVLVQLQSTSTQAAHGIGENP